jgi:protoheme IX farnesyltransferase
MSERALPLHLPRDWTRPWLAHLAAYWKMIKSLQTGLLLVTAAAGYISGCCLNVRAASLSSLLGSLFLAVSGSTVLNMAFDRDIDASMDRTRRRPLPAGEITVSEAWLLGAALAAGGVGWSLWIDGRYALVVLAGVVLDVAVYTFLLKRRSPFSIIIGGLAGGMPALAGRVLAVGRVDEVGLLLALGVLLWIPTHMMTFSIKHQVDYARAGVPTFPAAYGLVTTRKVIASSTLLAVSVLFAAAWHTGLPGELLAMMAASGGLLLAFVFMGLLRPGPRTNFALYKGASIYLLVSMLLLIAGGL